MTVDPRRQLPSIDALLAAPGLTSLLATHPRALVVKAARAAVDAARVNGGAAPAEGWDAAGRPPPPRAPPPPPPPPINTPGGVVHTHPPPPPPAPPAVAAAAPPAP